MLSCYPRPFSLVVNEKKGKSEEEKNTHTQTKLSVSIARQIDFFVVVVV